MRSIVIALGALLVAPACKKSDTTDCAGAIAKGVDQLRTRRKDRMAIHSADLTPGAKAEFDAQAKVMEAYSAKLKTALTTRCTEDKWPSEVIDCYESTSSPDDMRKCRQKLPAEQADRVRTEEVALMRSMDTGSGTGSAP
jgi:hypothetical protein